jgi:hypothetical protein
MTNEIKRFYWTENFQNCLAILNYEFQGVAEVLEDSYGNDESPSCVFTINGVIYKLFCPSSYKGEYSEFLLLDYSTYDENFQIDMLGEFATIEGVLNYFKNLNII